MMTELGFPMNHSSARNYVLRIMKKFAQAIAKEWNIEFNETKLDAITKSPSFQSGMADLLHSVEMERRTQERIINSL